MLQYSYCNTLYQTPEEAQAAASAKLVDLQTKPSTWCEIKELTQNPDGSFIVPAETIPDADAFNLQADKYYNVSDITSGVAYTAITGVEANQRVLELRTEYVQAYDVATIHVYGELATEADFSNYT